MPSATTLPRPVSVLSATTSNGPVPPVSMLDRVTCILDLFDHPRRRLNLEVISRQTGLPRSTTHRIMEHMIDLGWLDRTDSGYGLGPRVSGLARCSDDGVLLRSASAAAVHDLAVRSRRVVHLAMLEGKDVVYLDKVGNTFWDVPTRVGGRAPAVRTALGKAMLSTMRPERVEAQLTGGQMRSDQHQFGSLHAELAKIRRQRGLAAERGECVSTVACVAVPVGGGTLPLGAVSVVIGAGEDFRWVAPLVVEAGRRVSQELQRIATAAPGSSDDLGFVV